ncbi:hypothetical protein RJ639_039902 [Escallonia herrerae]|uniref:Protein CHUP1, chloroplastic n=1 Tax=Escallonia herrerae TaxID=1293975 RepID=A0AA88WKQ0_9ASTE|nr:hypothetical protein RJ639_039902 [Escallonia herrerae]
MMGRENRGIRPVLVKFGVALALSLGGILYSILRTKRNRPSDSAPSPGPSDCENQVDSGGLRSDDHALETTPLSCCTDSIGPEKHEELRLPKSSFDSAIAGLSPNERSNADKEGFLLPEFNELVKEFDLAAKKTFVSPERDVETLTSDSDTPRGYKCVERDEHEQEIKSLRNMIKILKERERTLEIQLLEYYGLKEQETAVMELQNRLKINNMEAKLFTLKIESLKADNRRLEAQVTNYATVVADLEAARAKVKMLKKKLRYEAEQNREQILTLQQRVTRLQDQEHKASDTDIEIKLQRQKDLEEEAEELRNSNHSLQIEKSDLAQRLEYVQILATSVLEDKETERLKQEANHLRKQNEDLSNEVERLQADRCVDIEEVVYLRWINACLRYELRNYQPSPGKTIARDLSRTLSPKSEEKAKQLILEYANKEVPGEKGISILEFDSDQWSSSQASYLTDSGEFDDSSIENSSTNKTNTPSKSKVFGKLMKLLRGKDAHHSRDSSVETSACAEDVLGTYSSDSPLCNSGSSTLTDVQGHRLRTSSQGSSRHSFNLQRPLYLQRLKSVKADDINELERTRRNSDSGSLYRKIDTITEGAVSSSKDNQLHQESEDVEKSELEKYAEVLKDSRGETSKFRRRSASFSSF